MRAQVEYSNTSISLPAVENKDLKGFLEKYDLLTAFMQGTIFCASCSIALNESNMGALLVHRNSLICYCNTSECIDVAMQKSK